MGEARESGGQGVDGFSDTAQLFQGEGLDVPGGEGRSGGILGAGFREGDGFFIALLPIEAQGQDVVGGVKIAVQGQGVSGALLRFVQETPLQSKVARQVMHHSVVTVIADRRVHIALCFFELSQFHRDEGQ